MSNLILELKVKTGADIEDVCYEAAELASNLKINVVFEFNGVIMTVNKSSNYKDLVDKYKQIKINNKQ